MLTNLLMDVYSINPDGKKEMQTFRVIKGQTYEVKPDFIVTKVAIRDYEHEEKSDE